MRIKTLHSNNESKFSNILFEYIPRSVKDELIRLFHSREGIIGGISELRLRRRGASSVLVLGERIMLSSEIGRDDMESCLMKLSGESLYAHRDSIAKGYISLEGGIRVGISGHASYDGDKLVGVSEISSFVFRIPSGVSEFQDELLGAFQKSKRGLIIYSSPGSGKTSALRALAKRLSLGRCGFNVAVIDERLEFSAMNTEKCFIDILSGYKKADGMEIALRTLSPDVIVVDEIGSIEEVDKISEFVSAGVRILASVHAGSFEELNKRQAAAKLIELGAFDFAAGLFKNNGVRSCKIDEL